MRWSKPDTSGDWLRLGVLGVMVVLFVLPIVMYIVHGFECRARYDRWRAALRTLVPIAYQESGVVPRDPMLAGPTHPGLELIEVYREPIQGGRRILISWPPEFYVCADNHKYVWMIDINPPSGMDWEISKAPPDAFGLDSWPAPIPLPPREAFSGIELGSYWFQCAYLYSLDGRYNRETNNIGLAHEEAVEAD